VVLIAVVVLLTSLGGTAWLILLNEGLLVVALVGAAFGLGAWPVVWLGLGQRGVLQQIVAAAALGLGLLGVLTLILGVVGGLTRVTAWIMVVIGWGLALARVYALQRQAVLARPPGRQSTGALLCTGLLLLTLVVPATVALFGACLPPGLLWNGESLGYDVLEYHLQGPREYFEAGRIRFLAHNVYTSFPQQMEMLYLLLMYLAGSPLSGAIPAQLLHAVCAVLTVLALVAWTAGRWPRCVVAVVAGSVPWLAYLGCLAYVELGMLLLAAVAAGLVLDQLRNEAGVDWRTTLAAGLYAGLSASCKYTALLLVAGGLALAWLAVMHGSPALRVRRLALFAAGTILAFAPWLVRNAAFTGNPVYPFAYGWLDGTAWGAEQAQQWDRGHRLPPEQDSVAGRLKITADELLRSRMFGAVLLPLALVGVVLARSRPAAMLAVWSLIIVAGWATLTHMPGRFVLPVIIPLALLAGLAIGPTPPDRGHRVRVLADRPITGAARFLSCVAFAGAIFNNVTLAGLLHTHAAWWGRQGLPLSALLGDTETLARAQPLNQMIPPNGYAWLVGEARAFYLRPRVHYTVAFSRDPWLTYASDATAAESVAWLRTRNVSHVVFSWDEIGRLRATYGFPALVTRGWVQSLAAAGLRLIQPPRDVDAGDIEVYEVLPS
jgi:hypothetical protein